jgi:CubicO group peptidase (beta-lactamase class C family)
MNTAPLRAGTANLVRLAAALSVALGALVLASPSTSADDQRPVQTSVEAGVDLAAVDRFMRDQLAAASTPGAAVAITRGDQVLYVAGYGHDGDGAAVTGDTLFRIASLSKSFTALAVMQLVEDGRVSLGDPVAMHLPEFQLADPRGADITVRQLLDQTSGLADSEVHDLSRPQPTTTAEAVTSLRSARLVADPGTQWNYHNPNYQVAARLVEVLSGETFGQYLDAHAFGPAGMTSSTTFETGDQAIPGLADGHVIAYGQPIAVRAPATYDVGAGGVVSTAADMARWLVVQTNNGRAPDGTRLLTGKGLTEMHTASAVDVGYALGWDTNGPAEAPTLLEHSGNLLTFSAYQAVLPASGYGVVVLLNTGSALLRDQYAIFEGVVDIVEGTDTTPSGPRYSSATLDTVLAFLTLAVLLLGVRGVRRSRRWATRTSGSWTRIMLRMLPYLAVLGLVAAFPRLAGELVGGRDVTWEAAAYGWPALVVLVLTALAATLATLSARAWQMRAIRGSFDTTTTSTRRRSGTPAP